MLILLTASPVLALVVLSSAGVSAAPANSLLSDNFTQDTSLNASLWQINGPAGTAFGSVDVGSSSLITLAPAFSSAGMEIDQINASYEAGTIQSLGSFTPPFSATAVVEGTVSNGHTFGFALATADASSGVLIYGNLNPTNCSNEGDCGDPTVCGNSATPAVPSGQCYYGMDAKAAMGTGNWTKTAKLDLTPSVNVIYTVQITVDASGIAQYSVSQGGQVLGTSTSNIGTGPFYVIMEQSEGAVVVAPGPNQAYWKSVTVDAGAAAISTASTTASGNPISTTTSSGISWFDWLLVAVVVILFLILLLLWYSRRRDLIISAEDSQALSIIPEALVSTEGPEKLSGYTDKDGKITFKGVKKGDYTVLVVAKGYNPSLPVKITVKKKTKLTVKLDRTLTGAQVTTGGFMPPAGPSSGTVTPEPAAVPQPSTPAQPIAPTITQPVQQAPSPTVAQPEPAAPREQQEPEEPEGFGGGRISEIIRTFQAKGAISPETALTADELGLSRLFVRIMKRRQGRTKVFIEINGRYYLNQDALKEMK
ncbi:MAG: hypothetical protein ABSA72_09475 [Nitrososphaerales archaeon]|jgi:hypothetical protein